MDQYNFEFLGVKRRVYNLEKAFNTMQEFLIALARGKDIKPDVLANLLQEVESNQKYLEHVTNELKQRAPEKSIQVGEDN